MIIRSSLRKSIKGESEQVILDVGGTDSESRRVLV